MTVWYYILIHNIDVFEIRKGTLYLNKLNVIINHSKVIDSKFNLDNDIEYSIESVIQLCKKKG
jgi:hypothetical protein